MERDTTLVQIRGEGTETSTAKMLHDRPMCCPPVPTRSLVLHVARSYVLRIISNLGVAHR